jgi:hypothetical protein
VRVESLAYSNTQTQGSQRRTWLRQHSPQHLEECHLLILRALRSRSASASSGSILLGAGACTEIPLAEIARASDEVVLADLDLPSMRRARDELVSPSLQKRVRLLASDLTGSVSANLQRLIEKQAWSRLVPQGATAIFDAAASCLEECEVPDPPNIEAGEGEFGLVVSSLTLSQLFSYPLLDMLDHIQRIAPDMLGEQERHHHYQEAAQAFRVRIILAHLHLLRRLVDRGGLVVLLSDIRGFVFTVHGTGHDAAHRRAIPLVPRMLPDMVCDQFEVVEERGWEWVTDLPGKDTLGRGYEVVGSVMR